jgi:hypothetical protein
MPSKSLRFIRPRKNADQIAAHGAADAAVIHLEDLFVGVDHQFVVDARLAEFVDDNGVLLAMRFGQDAVEKRGLASTEKAGQHGHRGLGVHGVTSVGQGSGQLRKVVAHHGEVGGRRSLRAGQRIGVERATDGCAGLGGDLVQQATVGDVLDKDGS